MKAERLGIFLLLGTIASSSEGAVLYSESFETDGNGSRYVATTPFLRTSLPYQHWNRIDPDSGATQNVSGPYTGYDGDYVWSAEQIAHFAGTGSENQYLNVSGIDISGHTNLAFSGLFGSGNPSGYESDDRISISYRVDGGPAVLALAFRAVPNAATNTVNEPIAQDTNLDGAGDGTVLGVAMQEFGFSIPDGDSVDLEVWVHAQALDEELAFDFFRIQGDVATTNVPEPAAVGLAVLLGCVSGMVRRRRQPSWRAW